MKYNIIIKVYKNVKMKCVLMVWISCLTQYNIIIFLKTKKKVTMKSTTWYVNFKTIKEYPNKNDKTTWLVQFPIK